MSTVWYVNDPSLVCACVSMSVFCMFS
jgi:hypothetical protein